MLMPIPAAATVLMAGKPAIAYERPSVLTATLPAPAMATPESNALLTASARAIAILTLPLINASSIPTGNTPPISVLAVKALPLLRLEITLMPPFADMVSAVPSMLAFCSALSKASSTLAAILYLPAEIKGVEIFAYAVA